VGGEYFRVMLFCVFVVVWWWGGKGGGGTIWCVGRVWGGGVCQLGVLTEKEKKGKRGKLSFWVAGYAGGGEKKKANWRKWPSVRNEQAQREGGARRGPGGRREKKKKVDRTHSTADGTESGYEGEKKEGEGNLTAGRCFFRTGRKGGNVKDIATVGIYLTSLG